MDLSAEELLSTTDKLTKLSDVICNYINEKYAHNLPDVIDLYLPQEVIDSFPFQYVMEAKLVKVTEQALVLQIKGATTQGTEDTTELCEDQLVALPYPQGRLATSKTDVKVFLEEMVFAAENRFKDMSFVVSQKKDSR